MNGEAGHTDDPALPENAGLEEIRAYLWRVHRVTVGADDPVLLLHTLHRAFLAETERLLARHGEALRASLGAAALAFAGEIKSSVEEFREKALTAGLENRLDQMAAQVRLAERIQGRLRSLLVVLGLLNLVSLGALALASALLIHTIR